MAKPFESNSLELRTAFHNAVSRFQDWTANVAEPKVKLHGRFCPISEICREVANLSDPLPNAILSILYKETRGGDDILPPKMDETYREAGQSLLRLIERRKEERPLSAAAHALPPSVVAAPLDLAGLCRRDR